MSDKDDRIGTGTAKPEGIFSVAAIDTRPELMSVSADAGTIRFKEGILEGEEAKEFWKGMRAFLDSHPDL